MVIHLVACRFTKAECLIPPHIRNRRIILVRFTFILFICGVCKISCKSKSNFFLRLWQTLNYGRWQCAQRRKTLSFVTNKKNVILWLDLSAYLAATLHIWSATFFCFLNKREVCADFLLFSVYLVLFAICYSVVLGCWFGPNKSILGESLYYRWIYLFLSLRQTRLSFCLIYGKIGFIIVGRRFSWMH